MVRNTSHFRVTRALRVLFIVDTRFLHGVRRFLRQIFKCFQPIIYMLILLFSIMTVYSVMGFHLFGPSNTTKGSPYFNTPIKSFISMFVLQTTANSPDVMMPSYHENKWSFLFFFSYSGITMLFLLNLLLAMVYSAFTEEEQKKFKKLFLHKRKACQRAFKLMATKENSDGVSFEHFEGVMSLVSPSRIPLHNILMFKQLNKSQSGKLTLEEFYGIYDAINHDWKPIKSTVPKHQNMIIAAIDGLVRSRAFDIAINTLIFANTVLILVQTSIMENTSDKQNIYTSTISNTFFGILTAKMALELVVYGPRRYINYAWNWFDIILWVIVFISYLVFHIQAVMIIFFLRILRLFKFVKRMREVFGAMTILISRLGAAAIILALIGYIFGVIGMEVFGQLEMKNCCEGATFAEYYMDPSKDSNKPGYFYYLNNFSTLKQSYVTLFTLMVVNNWSIPMEAFAIVSGTEWSRVFFMSYYIVMPMMFVTIMITFITEAFLYMSHYNRTTHDEGNLKLTLSLENVDFIATRRRNKEELQKMMYCGSSNLLQQWQEEAKMQDQRAKEAGKDILIVIQQ
jgi:two pore calcium channel protein 1